MNNVHDRVILAAKQIGHVTAYALLSFIVAATISACVWTTPASERIAKSRSKISKSFQTEIYRQQHGVNQGSLNITWQQGLNKMYLSNPKLIQADHRIEDAKSQQKQIWTNMIPSINVGASDSFQVRNLGDAFSNPVYRISSFISLGNILDLPNNVYARKLAYIGSQLQAEQQMRQQVIALYRLFQQQRLLLLEKKAIELETELLQDISILEDDEIISLRLKNRETRENWERNHREWKTKVGDFYMSGYDQINLKHSGIPNITYKPNQLDFSNTQRWGMLQLNLLALEKIAADGRVLDVYLRYLPTANLSVSAPPLYSNNSSQQFDAGRTRLSPSLNWSLDSRGHISRQLRRLKRESPIKKWRNDKRQRDEIQKLLEGKNALAKTQSELHKLRQAMNGYRNAVKAGLIKDPEKAIRTMRRLREREVRLAAREIEICTSFWLIDESRWKSITKRWLATRKARTNLRTKHSKKNKKAS